MTVTSTAGGLPVGACVVIGCCAPLRLMLLLAVLARDIEEKR